MAGLIHSVGNVIGGITQGIGNIFSGGSQSTGSTAAGLADPFASQRPQYQKLLSQIVNNPASYVNTPAYQFQFNQGIQALERGEAAGGNFGGGKMGTDLISFGQGLASTSLMQQEELLAMLGGATTGQPGTAGSLYASGANAAGSAGSGVLGALLSSLGGGSSSSGDIPGLVPSGYSDIGAISPDIYNFAPAAIDTTSGISAATDILATLPPF